MGQPKKKPSKASQPENSQAVAFNQTAKEKQALALLNEGNILDAETIYRELIKNGTKNHITYTNLATICGRKQKWNELLSLLNIALELEPNNPLAHNHMGIAFKEQGHLSAAIASFQTALKLRPNYTEAHNNLGITLQQKGDLENAIISYKKAIELQPNHAEYFNNLGNALQISGDLNSAIDSYTSALELNPNYPEVLNNLGNAFQETNDLIAAIISYNKALALRASYPEAHYNLANALQKQGDLAAAIASYNNALKLKPCYPKAYYNLGIALRKQGETESAIAAYKKAIALQQCYPEAYNNLGIALKEQGNLYAAITSYRNAIKLQSNYSEAYYNLGNALQEQGNFKEAITYYKNAIDLKPSYPEAYSNLSMAELMISNYEHGWKHYEYRFQCTQDKNFLIAKPSSKRWEGTPLKPDEQLLLVSEQGLGDTLQFMRYAIALRHQGFSVSLCAPTRLHQLIQTSGIDIAPFTPEQGNTNSKGWWVPLLSVPQYLKVSPKNPIVTKPYISTTKNYREKWQSILRNETRPIVGINWQGNPSHEKTNSKGRSLPLDAFSSIAQQTEVSLLSLQKGFGREQLDTCPFQDRFVGCQNQIDNAWNFLDTAAIVSNCDLIITSDTSVAHLAGGMGKPTWLLLKKFPEWRWGLEGSTTFWYPSMRLFRQEEQGNWDEVVQRVTTELKSKFPNAGATLSTSPENQSSQHLESREASKTIHLKELNIFCVSLIDAKERRDTISLTSKEHGLNIYFINAIDGRDLTRAELQKQTQLPIRWDGLQGNRDEIQLPTEAATCLSHIKAWRTILKHDLPHAIIIEDDVSIQRFKPINAPLDADLIYLSTRANSNSNREAQAPVSGSEAYYITNEGCKKLVKIFSAIKMPVDIQWLPQVNSLIRSKHFLSAFTDHNLPTINAYVEPGIFSLNLHSRKSQIRGSRYPSEVVRGEILAPTTLGELIDKITILQIKLHKLSGPALENTNRELRANKKALDALNLTIDQRLFQRLQEVNQILWNLKDKICDKERRHECDEAFIDITRMICQEKSRRAAIKKEINTICGSFVVEEHSDPDN